MKNSGRFLVFCIIVALATIMAGCAKNGDFEGNVFENSSAISGENEGISLPDVDFDTLQQTDSSNKNDTNISDKTQTSSQENSKQENSSSNENQDEESTPTNDNTSEDTTSDNISVPSERNDGSIELPMDKW